MKKKLVLLFFTTFLGLSACNPVKPLPDTNQNAENPDSYNGPSTTFSNILMGNGTFAYHNNFIYIATNSGAIEYDLLSKESVFIPSKHEMDAISYVDNHYIYFSQREKNGLMCMSKDGKISKTIYDDASGYYYLYLTETHAYYANSMNGSLFRYTFETDTEDKLCSILNGYFIDDSTLYVLQEKNDATYLYKSNLNEIDFQPVSLSFSPIRVIAIDDTLYLSKKGIWDIIMYKDGIETTLPIYSFDYQVLGNQIIYIDRSTNILNLYNLETGEIRTLFENAVYTFCILAERYIGIQSSNTYYLYDLESETLELMYPQEGE